MISFDKFMRQNRIIYDVDFILLIK